MSSVRPVSGTYSLHFAPYIALVTEPDVLAVLETQGAAFETALRRLPPAAARSRYAEGKWSVAQVVGHVVDSERVFGYRALATARGEKATLPSFDEDAYAAAAGHDDCPLDELLDELAALRRSHVLMFRHLDGAAWDLVRELRKGAQGHLPVIVLVDKPPRSGLFKPLPRADWLVKPFQELELQQQVTKLVGPR